MINLDQKTLIVLNGVFNHSQKEGFNEIISSYQSIIAVDGGYNFLSKITDKKPDHIIGDFDSLSKDSTLLKNYNGKISEFPSDKNKTDGELAIDYCRENNIKNVGLIGATGGRIDQQFGNLYLLEYAFEKDITAKIIEPGIEVGLVTDCRIIKGKIGQLLSLFSITDTVFIKRLKGCKYDLNDYLLKRASSRGISNTIKENKIVIEIDRGRLIYFTYRIS